MVLFALLPLTVMAITYLLFPTKETVAPVMVVASLSILEFVATVLVS